MIKWKGQKPRVFWIDFKLLSKICVCLPWSLSKLAKVKVLCIGYGVWYMVELCMLSRLKKLTTRKLSYCGRFFCGGCKNCRYMSHIAAFFGLPLWMRYIVAFHWTAAIDLAFCSVLQWRYINRRNTTVVEYKTAAIYIFLRRFWPPK